VRCTSPVDIPRRRQGVLDCSLALSMAVLFGKVLFFFASDRLMILDRPDTLQLAVLRSSRDWRLIHESLIFICLDC